MSSIINGHWVLAAVLASISIASLAEAQSRPSPYDRSGRDPSPQYSGDRNDARQSPPRGQVAPSRAQDPRLAHRDDPRRAAPAAPRAPFRLTEPQARFLDSVLNHWEKESAKVRTYRCKFARYEYDPVWVRDGFRVHKTESDGELKYASPDKGLFHITEVRHLVPSTSKYEARSGTFGEHWVSDGRSIWEYHAKKKQLIEHQLPPDMQGQAIRNGPLPFLFGAKAAELRQRYWMRVITPPKQEGKQIWIEAYPRHQQGAANFRRVELILDQSTFLPVALQVYLPNGKNRTVYTFYKMVVNDKLGFLQGDFSKPKLPRGWQKVVEAPPQPRRSPAPPERNLQGPSSPRWQQPPQPRIGRLPPR